MNTFEKQASEFIGVSVATGGTIEIASKSGVTKFVDPQIGATGNYVDIKLFSDASAIDFGSENSGGTGTYDSRIVSFKNVPFSNNNFAFLTDGNIQLLSPTQIGSPTAPAFKLDYASVSITPGSNPQTSITFTSGMGFTAAPVVVCTVQTPGDAAGDNFCFVESVSTTGCVVQYLGTASAGAKINYIALGV